MNARLTKTDWLDHGLRTLAVSGPNALKVAPMSTALKVSRGSFYWHFKDIGDFQSELLRRWQQRTTDRIILELESQAPEPSRLNYLIARSFNADNSLDRAVRYWAAEDTEVAKVVASVDVRRVAYITKLLEAAGVQKRQASARAAFLYWAYLGQSVVMDPQQKSILLAHLDEITELFKT